MNELFTWPLLATLAGAAAAAALVTQLVKDLPLLSAVPTQLVSYAAALLILAAAAAASPETAGWRDYAIVPINAAVVSLSGNGAYSAVIRAADALKSNEDERNP